MKLPSVFSLILCLMLMAGLYSFAPGHAASLTNDVLAETNLFRNENKLPALEMNEQLNALAQKHSENMASGRVSFGHDGFKKRNSMAFKTVSNIHFVAENVAFGASTAKEVLTMWKNSPGHRSNILGKYSYIGIGVAKDKKGRIYYTQVFAG
jgi:uncharacterized protein YkwD